MLDIARDRVPTTETLHWLVDVLQRFGYNQLELYMEHTFAYPGHEVVWEHASPITADEMSELDGYCAERGIALVPNQNVFGHMERWLQHPQYRDRAECPDAERPTTLAATEENNDFAQELLETLTSTCRTKAVNIGGDEPWEFGTGASKQLVEERGKGAIYAEHLARIARPWTDRGYRVQMWADVLEHHPEDAALLPDGVAPVVWLYESPASLAATVDPRAVSDEIALTDRADGFARRLSGLHSRGQRPWVAPGTGVWNSVTGRTDNCWENVQDAARSLVDLATAPADGSPAVSTEGMILTHWGDYGSWEPYVLLIVPLAYASVLARDPEGATREQAHELAAEVVGQDVVQSVLDLGGLDVVLDFPNLNASRLGLQALGMLGVDRNPSAEEIAEVRDVLARVRERHPDPAAPFVADLLHVVTVTEAVLKSFEGGLSGQARDEVLEGQRAMWNRTSRPGGLEDSLAHMPLFGPVGD